MASLKHPLNVLRHRDFDNAPRDPGTIGALIISAFGGTVAATSFIAMVVGYVATTLVTSWAMRALTPKPDFGSLGSQGVLVNSREPDAAHHVVYGEMRKGGTVTFIESTGEKNEYLHMIVALAGHPVDQIGQIYINDLVATIDGSGNVTDAFLDADGNPTIRIQKFNGTQTTAPADLLAESELTGADALTNNFVGRNIAYLYIRMKYDQSAYTNGVPLFTAVVRGKRVLDPRNNVTAWSDNAALCIRDYISSAYGLSDTSFNETSFSAAANICDELVPLKNAAGNVKRYTINGVLTAEVSPGSALNQMVTACAGTLFWGTGKWKLTVGDYIAPTKTLTLDDLRSGITVQTRTNLRDQFNTVQGTFINAAERWITQDYRPIEGAAFIAEDGGIKQPLDLSLPFTTNNATAERLAKLTLFRGREQATISADFGMNAFDIEVGEIIELNLDRYGWSNKEFEVIGWQLRADRDAGDLRVAMTLRETSAAAFDWNAEESDIIGGDTNLPDPFGGLAINNLTASGGGRLQGDGTFINSVILNWDDVTNYFADYYEVEWKALVDSVYSATTTEQSGIELSPLIDGIEYIFRIRAVTVAGVKGDWATIQFTGGGDVTAPGLPSFITATGHFEYIALKWVNPGDLDLNYIEIWENISNTTAGATKVGTSAGDSFQRTNLGLNVTRWYFLKSVDYSGNTSDFTSGVSATTTFIDDSDFANGVYSLFTSQGLYAIRDVTSLPSSGTFVGEKVYNRTDGKLYQWNGSVWDLVIAEPDTFIASDKIIANTITGGLLATSGIITNSAQINNAVITNAKIANLAVDSAKIQDLTVGTQKITDLAVSNTGGVEVATYDIPSASYTTAASFSFSTLGGKPLLIQLTYDLTMPTVGDQDSRSVTLAIRREGTIVKSWEHPASVGTYISNTRIDLTTTLDTSTFIELIALRSSAGAGTPSLSGITMAAVEYKK